jgi:hypothetical protein
VEGEFRFRAKKIYCGTDSGQKHLAMSTRRTRLIDMELGMTQVLVTERIHVPKVLPSGTGRSYTCGDHSFRSLQSFV